MHKYAVSFGTPFMTDPAWLQAASNAKLNSLEVSCSEVTTHEKYAAVVKAVSDLQKKGAVSIPSVHIPFGPFEVCTFSDPDEDNRRRSVNAVLDWLEYYKAFNAPNYTLHASIEPIEDAQRPAYIASFKKSLTEILPHFEKLNASLNVEILPRTCLGRTAEELLAMISDFPEKSVGVCMDVNHLCGCPEKLPQAIRLLSKRIRSFHISDYDGVDECHWYPGLGVIDWEAVMDEINAIKQDVLLIFECSGFVNTVGWQKPRYNWDLKFRDAFNNAWFLENVKQLRKMQADFRLP